MKLHEQAFLYLDKAAEDEVLVDEVIASSRVSDAVIGFHCQQAVEKLLKALLSHLGVRFRRTHDLRELLDLLDDHDFPVPEHLKEVDYLSPFAVELRYGILPMEVEDVLDRREARRLVREVRSWVEREIGQSK